MTALPCTRPTPFRPGLASAILMSQPVSQALPPPASNGWLLKASPSIGLRLEMT